MTFPPWPFFFQNNASAPSLADYCQTVFISQNCPALVIHNSESTLMLLSTKSSETKFDNIWHFFLKLSRLVNLSSKQSHPIWNVDLDHLFWTFPIFFYFPHPLTILFFLSFLVTLQFAKKSPFLCFLQGFGSDAVAQIYIGHGPIWALAHFPVFYQCKMIYCGFHVKYIFQPL